ncbi:uncharacterized protein BP01DRAFT_142279 [Aspergillus saccharolyticus JOP 1030-1]|uniref:Uncharacterized protein n=1 Tax=Aspergillus saccharolyticus JOP 1030-1 TaxID=1450539 RepID=A0A318Z4Z1_9EURO|nr:hypothetical protein BP01DRAFT_142279 [Aspergillus saccharolyticus JOP 1030-1]PYH42156.1 hypothetical protein BP01DRAFT_142279 [Aspergillus saccharolyticus JOP 1030-1]
MTTTMAPAALNVLYYFQKQELKLDFNVADRAQAYQNLNREGRIYATEPTAVYLPLPPSMAYLRDSHNGMVIGFTTGTDATRWCQTAVLARLHSPTAPHEVRIRRAWTEEALDQQLQVHQFPLFMPDQDEAPPSPGSSPDAQPAYSPEASQPVKGSQPGTSHGARPSISMQSPPSTSAYLPVPMPPPLLPAPLTIRTPERAPATQEMIGRRPRASSFY